MRADDRVESGLLVCDERQVDLLQAAMEEKEKLLLADVLVHREDGLENRMNSFVVQRLEQMLNCWPVNMVVDLQPVGSYIESYV